MMTLQSLKKILIILGICVALVFGVIYAVLYYIYGANQTIAHLTQTLESSRTSQQNVLSTVALVTESNADIERVNNSIVPADGDVAFIEYIESIAHNYNLQIVIDSLALSNGATPVGPHMNLLEVTVEVKGSWQNAYAFMSRMEALPYSNKLESVDVLNTKNMSNVDPTKQTPALGTWQERIQMSVLKQN